MRAMVSSTQDHVIVCLESMDVNVQLTKHSAAMKRTV